MLRWFPLLPRILHIYRAKRLSELQTWHAKNRSTDGKMRLVIDSPAHHFIETQWCKFATDSRNIRLGMATDGISPFGTMRSKYSLWPVVMMNYYIPPWLAIKKGYLFLSLVIPGMRYII